VTGAGGVVTGLGLVTVAEGVVPVVGLGLVTGAEGVITGLGSLTGAGEIDGLEAG
jgi:hypothetical protein